MNTNLREKFPILNRIVNGKPLVYFDNAATSPKPQSVISAITQHYSNHAGNPGRGIHTLAREASQIVASTREKLLQFLNGVQTHSVIYTKSATESLNLIAHSIERQYSSTEQKPTIIITEVEHHSNFLPWLELHKTYGFPLVVVPIEKDGTLDTENIKSVLKKNPSSILSITHCSNVSGQIIDISTLLQTIRTQGITVILDASQSIQHVPIDLTAMNVDFLVASAHKMYGPEGVGILVVKNHALKKLVPLNLGGGMVESVTVADFRAKSGVEQFEAGTQHTAGISGLSTAIDFINEVGFDEIARQEKLLTNKLLSELNTIQGITIINPENNSLRGPVVSFNCLEIHPHDIADFLDQQGIAVRAGNHCAEPLHRALSLNGSVRVSLSFVNTEEEIDYFVSSLKECLKKFA